MKKFIIVIGLIAMIWPVSSQALTGLSFGAKVGLMEYGGDVLPASGDVGSGTAWAVLLGIGSPILDLELRANYFARDFDYSYDVGGTPVGTSFRFQDASAILLLKKDLFAPPMSPFALYIGAGGGVHYLNTEVAVELASGTPAPSQSDSPLSTLGTFAKPSATGLLGFRISPPMFPLAVFGEAGYETIFASSRLNVSSFSAGLMLHF